MSDNEIDFDAVIERIRKLRMRHEQDLSSDTNEAVEHYLSHDEFEIALEGLCLDLIEQGLMDSQDADECLELGRLLGLDSNSVLNGDFWRILIQQASELSEEDVEK